MSRIGVFVPSPHLRGGGEKHGLAMAAALAPEHDVVVLTDDDVDLGDIGRFLDVQVGDLAHVALRHQRPRWLAAAFRARLPVPVLRRLCDVARWQSIRSLDFDLFVNAGFQSTIAGAGRRNVSVCMFPITPAEVPASGPTDHGSPRQEHLLDRCPGTHRDISASYDEAWTISTFADEWLHRWWPAATSRLIFPPCTDMSRPEIPKENVILSVGRFIGRGGAALHKSQDRLVEAFSTLVREEGLSDWTLVLAGSVHPGPETAQAMGLLREAIRDLPVELRINATHDELRSLYNRAKLYWHATGFATDPAENPVAQEHFGITTVEAMTAAAVPLVFAGAGARDTVIDGVTGHQWAGLEQLVARTGELMVDEAKRLTLAERAQIHARQFDTEAFEHRVRADARRLLEASA